MPCRCLFVSLCLLCLWGTSGQVRAQQWSAPAARGVVFVADGSGGLTNASKNLETIIAEANLCLCVERVEWSRGRIRFVTDLVDHDLHLTYGNQLAGRILGYRNCNPDGRIILVGHSCGAAVVLEAARCLPADTVDRIILLAPCVSASYDLRPALRASREGVDSFYSKHDQILSTFIPFFGTADRRWEASGGWLGFDAPADCGEGLARKLRQYGYSFDLYKTGYLGGHYGCRNVGHMRERVLPLLYPTTCETCAQDAPQPVPAQAPVPAPAAAPVAAPAPAKVAAVAPEVTLTAASAAQWDTGEVKPPVTYPMWYLVSQMAEKQKKQEE